MVVLLAFKVEIGAGRVKSARHKHVYFSLDFNR